MSGGIGTIGSGEDIACLQKVERYLVINHRFESDRCFSSQKHGMSGVAFTPVSVDSPAAAPAVPTDR